MAACDHPTILETISLEELVPLAKRGVLQLEPPPPGAMAYIANHIAEQRKKPILWITDGPNTLETLIQDYCAISGKAPDGLFIFAAWETFPPEGKQDADTAGGRLSCLQRIQTASTPFVFTTIQALLQKTVCRDNLDQQIFNLQVGSEVDPDKLTDRLDAEGYEFEAEVYAKGQLSKRGGILDIWPIHQPRPFRIEFFGDTIESIRSFDPEEQLSLDKCDAISLLPANEWKYIADDHGCCLLDYLGEDPLIVQHDATAIEEHARMHEQVAELAGSESFTLRHEDLLHRLSKRHQSSLIFDDARATYRLNVDPADHLPSLMDDDMQPDILEEQRRAFVQHLCEQAKDGNQVHIYFDTEGSRDRFLQAYVSTLSIEHESLQFHTAPLSCGFYYAPENLIVLAESDLYGHQRTRRKRSSLQGKRVAEHAAGTTVLTWRDLQPGDFVVHIEHGIGRYLGLYEIEQQGTFQEMLAVEYADNAKLYIPVTQIQLLSRYMGTGKHQPTLHSLGGRRWINQKQAAENAVEDLAASLLETHAKREALKGYAFSADTPWQLELEHSFPYEETDDQWTAIEAVRTDMEKTRPMDRLICGDVGYGKTEVAVRAAFKAVMDGKQVAILVPTTILAQQHYETFSRRMAPFPVTLDVISRFRSQAEQTQILNNLREGGVDIIIGTHRLLSKDVAFKDLGLVIIDEEQRFGVAHKERFKKYRELVDVLTLTATPIPRTLYLSLTGARDMSTIQTPPQERLPIETLVSQYDEETIRQAILRELNREGQVFFLHNRVQSIQKIYQKLCKLVPEAKFAVAHGQMGEKMLASIMHQFTQGEIDVLLCTTIIESGVDIPNVNTIIIDRADRFGMADLYQLRGRVGRYKHRAYAYLLLPRHGQLFDNARKRIRALKQYSGFGAGFKLALRDLEIRGAGNLLGAEQSGHIAAVGFELYCQLLKRTVAQMQGHPLPPLIKTELKLDFISTSARMGDDQHTASIPYTYIEDENQRIELYRQIAALATPGDIPKLKKEIRDRFGPIPAQVKLLLELTRLKIIAANNEISKIEVQDSKFMMTRHRDYIMINKRFPRLEKESPGARIKEMIQMIRNVDK